MIKNIKKDYSTGLYCITRYSKKEEDRALFWVKFWLVLFPVGFGLIGIFYLLNYML
jgi:hypothetical protein